MITVAPVQHDRVQHEAEVTEGCAPLVGRFVEDRARQVRRSLLELGQQPVDQVTGRVGKVEVLRSAISTQTIR